MAKKKAPKKKGRKPLDAAKIIKKIAGHISTGLTQKDACTLEGISHTTFHKWLKKVEFAEAIKKAEVGFKQTHINVIAKAGEKGNWTASAWMLERKFHEEFGDKKKFEHSGGMTFTDLVSLVNRGSGNGNGGKAKIGGSNPGEIADKPSVVD